MAANGHLIDQFLQDNSNKRTDRYGGTIENRARLLFEAVEALISVWGADRVGVRIAPSGTYNGMADSNPHVLFRYVAERLNDFKLAYLHVIEPRIKGGELIAEGQGPVAAQELSKVFHGPIIAAGGFEPDTAEMTVANDDASLIAFGRHFIANPDLPKRIELGLPLNPYDRSTFYAFDARGYTDYPEIWGRTVSRGLSGGELPRGVLLDCRHRRAARIFRALGASGSQSSGGKGLDVLPGDFAKCTLQMPEEISIAWLGRAEEYREREERFDVGILMTGRLRA